MEDSTNTLNSSPTKSKFRLKLELAINYDSNHISPKNKLRDRFEGAKKIDKIEDREDFFFDTPWNFIIGIVWYSRTVSVYCTK